MGNQRAFTLIEILLSIVLLAGLGLAIVSFTNRSNSQALDAIKKSNVEGEMRDFLGQVKKSLQTATALTLGGTAKTPLANLQSFPQITITQGTPTGDVSTTLRTECVAAPGDVSALYQTVPRDYLCIRCDVANQLPQIVWRDSANNVLSRFPINAAEVARAYSGEMCFNRNAGATDKMIGIVFRAFARRTDASTGQFLEETFQLEGGVAEPAAGGSTRIIRKF